MAQSGPAPVIATDHLQVDPNTSPELPATLAEDLSKLDPVFATAWNNSKYLFNGWQGDNSFIGWVAAIAYRYKSGTGVLTPSISGISPTSTAHNAAFALTVNGTNLDPGAKVLVTSPGGSVVTLAPATSTPTQITASVPASAIPTAGTYTVSVRNLNGAVSSTTNLTVT